MELFNWFMKQINSILEYSSHHAWAALLCFFTIFVGPYSIYLLIKNHQFQNTLRQRQESTNRARRYTEIENVVEVQDERIWNDIVASVSPPAVFKDNRIEEIYSELHEDLLIAFGDDYRAKFPLPGIKVPDNFYAPSNNNYWAAHLLLAHKGYVYSNASICGWPLGGIDDIEKSVAILKRIEYHINLHHPDSGGCYDLYYEGAGKVPYGTVQTDFYTAETLDGKCGGRVKMRVSLEALYNIGVALWEHEA